jgi:hypothetical protein
LMFLAFIPLCVHQNKSQEISNNYNNHCNVRQEDASQIAVMPLLPFGVTLLWHAFSVMKRCEAHKTMWKTLKV